MAVDPANPDLVYVGTLVDGLMVTFDAGKTWSPVSTVPLSKKCGLWLLDSV